MQKKIINLAIKNSVKYADKIDPSLIHSLGKVGIKVPGTNVNEHPGQAPPQATTASTTYPPYHGQQAYNSASPSAHTSAFAPIAPQYATNQPMELWLKEKTMSWTGDDAKITDSNGNTMFQIQAGLVTFSQRRTMVDSNGNTIAQLRHKKLDLAPTMYIGTPQNDKKVKLKTSGMFNPLNCNAKISINGMGEIGHVKGNWRAKKYSIYINGFEVARISRKRTMASTFLDADSYKISVTPPPNGQPVDLAFISLIVIGLDELYHDD